MPDREKVIKWLEYDYLPRVGAYRKDCKQGCDACMPMHDGDGYCDIDMLCKILSMLKEQEAVKPVRDEQTGRMWLCGNCGSYVGFEDNDPYDQNEFDKFCRECGKPVLWEGR